MRILYTRQSTNSKWLYSGRSIRFSFESRAQIFVFGDETRSNVYAFNVLFRFFFTDHFTFNRSLPRARFSPNWNTKRVKRGKFESLFHQFGTGLKLTGRIFRVFPSLERKRVAQMDFYPRKWIESIVSCFSCLRLPRWISIARDICSCGLKSYSCDVTVPIFVRNVDALVW